MRRRLADCRRPAVLGLVFAVAAGCTGVDDLNQVPLDSAEPPAVSRLAEVHVVIQQPGDFAADEPALEVAAVFANYHGYDEAAARTRLDLDRPLSERLRVGHCASSDQLAAADEAAAAKDSSSTAAARELILLDAGNLTVSLGDATIDVPLALLPDLVPTISGVNYSYFSDVLPPGAWSSGEPAPSELTIRVDGESDELPGFTLRPRVPEPLVLAGEVDRGRGELRLDWRPGVSDEPVVLRLVSLIGGEPIGDEVTCLVADDGEFSADLRDLHALGLDASSGTALRVGATRTVRAPFDAGEFIGAEARVELRTSLILGS